jgi:hypothetical protein
MQKRPRRRQLLLGVGVLALVAALAAVGFATAAYVDRRQRAAISFYGRDYIAPITISREEARTKWFPLHDQHTLRLGMPLLTLASESHPGETPTVISVSPRRP